MAAHRSRSRAKGRALALTIGFACVLSACVCSRMGGGAGGEADALRLVQGFTFDKAQVHSDLNELTRAPHPFGSPRQGDITTFLERRLSEMKVRAVSEPFTAVVPNPAALGATGPVQTTLERSGANVYGFGAARADAPCVVALASHYDTKILSGAVYLGANDSGSSTAALLQQLGFLERATNKGKLVCDVIGIFFDGEESVLADWNDGLLHHPAKMEDHTYGSRHAAGRLKSCRFGGREAMCLPDDLGGKPLVAVILMDMIGSPGITLTRDAYSSPLLLALTGRAAQALSKPSLAFGDQQAIEDDHLPYLRTHVAALDLIDFNHLDVWHKAGDDPDKLSLTSIETAARTALYVALAVAENPKDYLEDR